MNREQLAELIDAYADARVTGNKYLCREMIGKLEEVLTGLYDRLNYLSSLEPLDSPIEEGVE